MCWTKIEEAGVCSSKPTFFEDAPADRGLMSVRSHVELSSSPMLYVRLASQAHTEVEKIARESNSSLGPPHESTTAVVKPTDTQAAPAVDTCHSELEPIAATVPSDRASVPAVDDVSTSAPAAQTQALGEHVTVAGEGEGGEETQLETLDTKISGSTSPLIPDVDASIAAGVTAAEPDVTEGDLGLVEAKAHGTESVGAEETADSIVSDAVASSPQEPLVMQSEDGGVADADAVPSADDTVVVPDGGGEGKVRARDKEASIAVTRAFFCSRRFGWILPVRS